MENTIYRDTSGTYGYAEYWNEMISHNWFSNNYDVQYKYGSRQEYADAFFARLTEVAPEQVEKQNGILYKHDNGTIGSEAYWTEEIIANWNDNVNKVQSKYENIEAYKAKYFSILTEVDGTTIPQHINTIWDFNK